MVNQKPYIEEDRQVKRERDKDIQNTTRKTEKCNKNIDIKL